MDFHRDPKGTWLATRHWAKSGPPRRGCPVKVRGRVATLDRATGPLCAPLLTTNLHRAITVGLPSREGL